MLSWSAPHSCARWAQSGAVGRSWCRSLAAVLPGLVIDSVRVKGSSGGGADGGRPGWSGSIGCVLALWSQLRASSQGRLGPLLPGDALLRVDDSVLRIGAEEASAVLRERSCWAVWEPWLRGRMTAKVLIRGRDTVLGTHRPARVSQFLLIMCLLPPRRRGRLGFLAGWPAQGMGREIWRR
jgi:hypothetical protein